MSDYTPATDFSAKDALTTGDPEKAILGSDVDAELDAIATAIASKLNSSGYTAADVLAKLLTVDGAGSTLDADSVDGVGPFVSGTYAPTLTNGTNLDASNLDSQTFMYFRIGNIVHVSGFLFVDATAAGGATTRLDISLPIASNLGNFADLAGVGSTGEVDETVYIFADTVSNRADLVWKSLSTADHGMSVMFSYKVI